MNISKFPIGIAKETIEVYNYNFTREKFVILSSNELENCFNFMENTMKILRKFGNTVSVLFDFENVCEKQKPLVNSYCNSDFENFSEEILKYYDEKIKDTSYNLFLYIVGVEKFNETMKSNIIEKVLSTIKNNNNIACIFIDNAFKFKKVNFESWYTSFVQNTNGIWIGSGIMDQSVIKLGSYDKKYSLKISNEFGWISKNGVGTIVKFINKV